MYLGSGNDKHELALRGGDTKTTKGRSYIDHSEITFSEERSTTNLPNNAVVMRHEVRHETAPGSTRDMHSLDRGYSSEEIENSTR